MKQKLMVATGAQFDQKKQHRYSLHRFWDLNKPKIMFIGLNPSRADHEFNDHTIRRCINFAEDWGYGGLYFANLFSFRTPYVKKVPAGEGDQWVPLLKPGNKLKDRRTDAALKEMINASEMVVCAWGSWDFTKRREKDVLSLIQKPYCMGKNMDGSPKHPLYLSSATKPELFFNQN